ncbi:hypothetical protein DSM112329_02860 [Paraconexibacter sp. AEG42_29]|uniref:Uncharacterized protein n=1 Tax=Paraconexibacter sp. AEG42_29 TaxID=2997339 RepID=A0AAU7AWK8_9ACTN
MLYENIVQRVGRERYERACLVAQAADASYGKEVDTREPWPDNLEEVPHEVSDLWFETGVAFDERLAAGLRALREMPCYATTMYMTAFFHEMTPGQQERLWDAYREALEASEPARACTVGYSLWVDYFEDASTSGQAFTQMTAPGGKRDVRIEPVLAIAGPAPWSEKRRLFQALIPEPRWHAPILRAISGSLFDAYGGVGDDVAEVLAQLSLHDAHPGLEQARAAAARSSARPSR